MDFLGQHAAWIAFGVTSVVALVAAVIDFRRFRVPNVLTFPLCLSGLLFHTIVHGWAGLQYSAAGIGLGILALIVFYIVGVMGAGDVKLLAAVGAWIGPVNTLYVFCVAGLAAGVHSLVVLGSQSRLREIPLILQVTFFQLITLGRHMAGSESASLGAAVERSDRTRYVMPFAVMIAIGVLAVAVWGWR